jgi:hypothetical protein
LSCSPSDRVWDWRSLAVNEASGGVILKTDIFLPKGLAQLYSLEMDRPSPDVSELSGPLRQT